MPLTILIQHNTRSSGHCGKARKRNKKHASRRNKTVPICKEHDDLCRKSQKIYRKALEPLSVFSKVTGHKIKTEISIQLLYMNKEHVETEKTNHSIIYNCSKENKILSINSKHIQGLSAEKCKMLIKKSKKMEIKTYHVHGLEDSIHRDVNSPQNDL